jgi:hypothetical protein
MTDAIKLLKVRYDSWRAMHDDGNGFYRALFVGFLEGCIQSGDVEGLKYLGDRYGARSALLCGLGVGGRTRALHPCPGWG